METGILMVVQSMLVWVHLVRRAMRRWRDNGDDESVRLFGQRHRDFYIVASFVLFLHNGLNGLNGWNCLNDKKRFKRFKSFKSFKTFESHYQKGMTN